jgi:putative ABC transport system ATP-binding protein
MIRFRAVTKRYAQGGREVTALADVTHTIERGEFVAVMGPSGSGKSTFLHLAAGLDQPTSGEVFVDGVATSAMDDDALTLLRRDRVGLVFQFFNLVPTLSVLENAALPLLVAGQRLAAVRPKAEGLVERMGLRDRLSHSPDELSGGEIQRVAIARALMNDPQVLLADEPTGNLDSATGGEILELLASMASGRTVVMVTHDAAAAAAAQRRITLRDGRLVQGQG